MNGETLSGLAPSRPSQLDTLYSGFHRAIAAACLAMGIFYWVRLLGFYPGLMWRFDLMPVHWQIASVILAVIYPFASVGLWLIAPWGAVIWFLCAAAEVVMYGPLSDLFGDNYPLIGFHLLVAVSYGALRFVRYHSRRKALQ
ncbi:MAG: hypothetical protein CMH69_19885 [Nitratireductor sp.]|uniref:DUF6163 family protein n=1 Tax=Nitratireductor sp. B36 TaxID=2762059 RepID=UPI000C8DA257|nr:hypothetical protein [Nitratireductor sp.]MCC5777918.1 hypothetical protein [Nitratireductor sp. B36]